MLLENKGALLVGASGPLGREIALGLASAGANVVLNDLSRTSEDDSLVSNIKLLGRRVLFVPGDVTDVAQMKTVVGQALAEFPSVDILVNNASIHMAGSFLQMTKDEWDRLSRINLRGVFVSCQAILPHMLERGSGAIINVVSQDALKGKALEAGYCITMGGVIAFTKALALEVGRRGIRVNAVAPGLLKTRATRKTSSNKSEANTLGRLGTPEEVAPSVVFLASDQASLFFGQVLCPNGGDFMI